MKKLILDTLITIIIFIPIFAIGYLFGLEFDKIGF
jgi:hypothetical protein